MRAALLVLPLLLAVPASAQQVANSSDRALHERLLVLDSHLDTPMHFGRVGWDITKRHSFANDLTQLDLPRMAEGGLDGGFFVIYTPQGELTPEGYLKARAHALYRAAVIHRTVADHPDRLELAYTPADAVRIAAAGKRIVFQSIENSYPLGEDVALLRTFRDLGVRMAGPVHFRNNQFADSATDKPRWNGLSPLGRRWVAEMNRLGMIIDASHASDAVFDQMLALSRTPIILSHTGPKAAFDHARNIDDARLKKLAAKGGVIHINSVYLIAPDRNPKRDEIGDRAEILERLSPEEQQQVITARAAIDREVPPQRATFDMFMNSLLHCLKLVGPDHVGLGADWDGGGGVAGMEDVSDLPKITARLRQAGYSEADLRKIMGGNLLRVLGQVERHAASVKK